MPDDGLSTGQNMLNTCKGTFGIKMNLCCVRLNKHSSSNNNKDNKIASKKITGVALFMSSRLQAFSLNCYQWIFLLKKMCNV